MVGSEGATAKAKRVGWGWVSGSIGGWVGSGAAGWVGSGIDGEAKKQPKKK